MLVAASIVPYLTRVARRVLLGVCALQIWSPVCAHNIAGVRYRLRDVMESRFTRYRRRKKDVIKESIKQYIDIIEGQNVKIQKLEKEVQLLKKLLRETEK